MKVKDFIDIINRNNIWALCEVEDCRELRDKLDSNNEEFPELIAYDLEIDRHKWYSTSVDVYKLDDGFVGVYGVDIIYGDMYYEDCGLKCQASEYEEYSTISYRIKK